MSLKNIMVVQMSSETTILGLGVTFDERPEDIEEFIDGITHSTEWANLFYVWATTLIATTAFGLFGGVLSMVYIRGIFGGVVGAGIVVLTIYLGLKSIRIHKENTLKLILKTKNGEYECADNE